MPHHPSRGDAVIFVSSLLLLLVAVAALVAGVLQSVMPLVYSSIAAGIVFGLLLVLCTVRRRSRAARADSEAVLPEDGLTSGPLSEERPSTLPADAPTVSPAGPAPTPTVLEPPGELMFPGPAIFGRLRRQPPVPARRSAPTAVAEGTAPKKAASSRGRVGSGKLGDASKPATRKPAGARSR